MPTAAALYPPIEAYTRYELPVTDGHRLGVAEFGNPRGVPAVFLHGGPGSACNPQHARLFDPHGYRLIQPDQRGCGRSRPLGTTVANTTEALLDDLETLRRHLAIDRWLVHGGSWGGTLAIAYAKRHAARVLGLVLRAPFLARDEDLAWFTAPDGVARSLPDAYAELRTHLECAPDDDLVQRLHERLDTDGDSDGAYQTALAWDGWEAAAMGLPSPAAELEDDKRAARIARKRIFAHYCRHSFFLGDAGVLPGIEGLDPIPGTIVHGTHDRVCRYRSSQQLVAKQLPSFELITVDGAGHGLHEHELQDALRRALDATLRHQPRRS